MNRAFAALNLDQINIILMLLSCAVAFTIPFELVLISYAFLGPAHYLTEISWLHDRNYFTDKKWIWVPLTVLSAVAIVLNWGAWDNIPQTYYLFAAALALSAAFIFTKAWPHRLAVFAGMMAIFAVLQTVYPPFVLATAFLLPTIIHIYLFTGLFILAGALKSRSAWGGLSLAVFIACGLSFFFITPSVTMISTDFIDRNLGFFDPLVNYVTSVVTFGGRVNAHSVLAFLSFAYTYHYLNWFSKTEIIKWHLIPRRRFALIAVLYLASVGIYLIDFRAGFITLTFLSLAHVLLELPLNILSMRMISNSIGPIRTSRT